MEREKNRQNPESSVRLFTNPARFSEGAAIAMASAFACAPAPSRATEAAPAADRLRLIAETDDGGSPVRRSALTCVRLGRAPGCEPTREGPWPVTPAGQIACGIETGTLV